MCQSLDHLNYSSDCSERYYTAAGGPDTMDELESPESKGAISILSNRTIPEQKNAKLARDSINLDEMCTKVSLFSRLYIH